MKYSVNLPKLSLNKLTERDAWSKVFESTMNKPYDMRWAFNHCVDGALSVEKTMKLNFPLNVSDFTPSSVMKLFKFSSLSLSEEV